MLEKQFWEQIGDTLESWQQGVTFSIDFQCRFKNAFESIYSLSRRVSIVEEVTSDLVILKTLKDFAHSKNSVWDHLTESRTKLRIKSFVKP